jgi:hypothetical protein
MHRIWLLSRFILPVLAVASFAGKLKWGFGIAGFSSGN